MRAAVARNYDCFNSDTSLAVSLLENYGFPSTSSRWLCKGRAATEHDSQQSFKYMFSRIKLRRRDRLAHTEDTSR
jgi:hypothetical protein